MPSLSVFVIVKIENYDPAFKYSGYIRPAGSTEDIDMTSPYYMETDTDTIKFFNLFADANYEVGVRKHCTNTFSNVVWKEITSIGCSQPSVAFAGTTFTLSFVSGIAFYEWRINDIGWTRKAVANNTVTIAEINAASDNHVTLNPNAIIDYQFRSVCSDFEKSEILHVNRVTTLASAASLSLISNLCSNAQYDGQKIRITLGGNLNGSTEAVSIGALELIQVVRTGNFLEDIKTFKDFLSGFNILKVLDAVNPLIVKAVSFDFISKIPPYAVEENEVILCNNYPTDFTVGPVILP